MDRGDYTEAMIDGEEGVTDGSRWRDLLGMNLELHEGGEEEGVTEVDGSTRV